MTRRLNAQIAALHTLVDQLRTRTPGALAHARDLAADGWPTGGDSNVRSKNAISDPTANAALNNTTGTGPGYRIIDQVQRLEQLVATAAVTLGDALTIVDRLMPPPGATPRCSGGAGLDGHIEWADPSCVRVPDGRPGRRGMCDACYQRYDRWRRVPRTAEMT